MRVFVLLVLFFGFLMSDVNESNEVFLKLDIKTHTEKVNDILITKDKKYFITASDDKKIKVWNLETGKVERKILGQINNGREGKILSIALSLDNKYLAVGGMFTGIPMSEEKYNIRIYDFNSGTIINLLKGQNDSVFALDFSEDGKYLVSASADASIGIWDVTNIKKAKLIDKLQFDFKHIYSLKIIKKNNDYIVMWVSGKNFIWLL